MPDIYEVTWVDSHSMGDAWATPDEVVEFSEKSIVIKTICYILNIMADKLIVCMCVSESGDQAGGVWVLPRQAIISARKLKVI